MTFYFSGPSNWDLSAGVIGAIFVANIYISIAKTSNLPRLILIIRELANHTFYHFLLSLERKKDSKTKAIIYTATQLFVNTNILLVSRHLQLIGNKGTIIFSFLLSIELACKSVDLPKFSIID